MRGMSLIGIGAMELLSVLCLLIRVIASFLRYTDYTNFDKVLKVLYAGPSGILGSDRKQNTAYAGARGVRIVALSISSHEQTQYNGVCCFLSISEESVFQIIHTIPYIPSRHDHIC